jgi:hypothetical protein
MYEKPQYFTKDGFKRCAKNPHKDQRQSMAPLGDQKKQLPLRILLHKKNNLGISDEAARLIAGVLKGMLK